MTTRPKTDPFDMSRRSLLRLGVAGGVLMMSPAAFAASGGDPDAKRGGTLTIGADADPIGLDPVTNTAFSSGDFTGLLYTGLLRWSPDMQIEPDLATGYEMPDETTYVFTLRDGVTFHNGQEFSAEDVKHTFDRIMDPATGARWASSYTSIESVTVKDPLTVEFKLKTPDAAFLRYLATNPAGAIVPKGVEDLVTQPVGTGPFMFESYEPNREFVLVGNPNYYEDGQPYLDKVIFRFFKDQSALASALRSRSIDMTWLKNPKVADLITRTQPDLVSAPGQTSRTFPVWFNLKAAPMNDVNVRRALSLATDRQACLDTVLGGSGKVGAALPESQIGGYDGVSDLPYYGQDIEGAKKLLAEAGHPDGIDLGDYIVVAANDLDVACAQILQQQWAQAGINVNIKPTETAPLLEMWNKGTYSTLLSVADSWTPDPDAIFLRMSSRGTFGTNMGMDDEAMDQMIAEARTITDPEKRAAANQDIQRRIADQAYVLHIYQYPLRWEAWWNYVQGYHALAANTRTYVRTTWIDK